MNPNFVNCHSWYSAVWFTLSSLEEHNRTNQFDFGASCGFVMTNEVYDEAYSSFENHVKMGVLLDLLLSFSHRASMDFKL